MVLFYFQEQVIISHSAELAKKWKGLSKDEKDEWAAKRAKYASETTVPFKVLEKRLRETVSCLLFEKRNTMYVMLL